MVAKTRLASIKEDEETCEELAVLKHMSDFEIGECQLQGSFVSVHRCKSKHDGEVFAVMRLAKKSYTQTAGAKREREALYYSRHPNILTLYWSFELANDWILIYGYYDLGSLRQHMDKIGEPGLSIEESKTLCNDALDGLGFLHEKRILHRDVHTTTISICGPLESAKAKLLDTGFSKRCPSGVVVGTDGYRAPEIEDEKRRTGAFRHASRDFDETVDLYSLGIVLFVTLVGNEATSSRGLVWQHADFRDMLENADNCLWHCDVYQDTGIFGLCQLAEMEESGAIATISALTETNPKSRPRSAALARELPFLVEQYEDCECEDGA